MNFAPIQDSTHELWKKPFVFTVFLITAVLLNGPLLLNTFYSPSLLFLDYSHNTGAIYDAHKHFFYWWAIRFQSHSLFGTIPCPLLDPDCHEGKMVFRIIVPLIYTIAGNAFAVYLIQLAAGIVFMKLIYNFLINSGLYQIPILLFLVSFVSTYAGHAFLFDVRPNGDAFAYLFLMLAFRSRNGSLLLLYTQLAFWTDERSLLCMAYMPIIWLLEQRVENEQVEISFSAVFKNTTTYYIMSSILIYVVARYVLTEVYNIKIRDSQINLHRFINDPKFYIIGLINSFKSYFTILICWVHVQYKLKNTKLIVLILIVTFIHAVLSFTVMDVHRSFAYIFPLILVLTVTVLRSFEGHYATKLLLLLTLINLFFPLRHMHELKSILNHGSSFSLISLQNH